MSTIWRSLSRGWCARPPCTRWHGRLDLPHLQPVFTYFHGVPVVSISDAQRAPLRALDVNWATTVHHGLALARYPYSSRGGRYLVFLGRISPEKRPDLAIAVAKRIGLPLKIAAKVMRKRVSRSRGWRGTTKRYTGI
jgi:glycosyltransferase involved in cell wall biosynthesis